MLKKGMPVFVAFLLVSGCGADINTSSTSEDDHENEEVDEIDVAAYEYPAPQVPEGIAAEFEMEHPIVVYFSSSDEDNIYVDITEALRHHQQSLNPHTELDFVDMASGGVISKENLTLINLDGEHIKEDELLSGDELYLDYDLSEYDSLKEEMDIDVMVVNPVTAKDIVENYYSSEEGRYRVSTLNNGAGGQVIDLSWDELDLILGHPKVQGYRNINQEQGTPSRRDLQSALGLESLPQLIVFDHQGVAYHIDSVEELLHYLE
ncbi:hypothetical protein BTR22_04685 [Alkalihalophilus pseudofirmus]|uniref:hypothetical protein n=1 Tax=Alkalihalophilus pseudofirmus TaxID=79885 RepID=UPI000952B4CB|nr:hypothetical protein BTR22_04685 [Alkalihalophilus pseudofirmus]